VGTLTRWVELLLGLRAEARLSELVARRAAACIYARAGV